MSRLVKRDLDDLPSVLNKALRENLVFAISFAALACLFDLQSSSKALAISVEVAKKCANLAGKAYPVRMLGNPAAGYLHGTAEDYRKYFNQCVANGGNMDIPPESGHQDPISNPNPSPNSTSDDAPAK